MTLLVDFLDETHSVSEDVFNLIENLLQYAYKEEKIKEDCEVSITFVTNDNIQKINHHYRDKDAPTDVISFALEESTDEIEIKGVEMPRVLGDIIISTEKAQEQADEYGHSFQREMGFLAVHGFLHLLGYDHMDEQEEKEMFHRQNEILNGYGLTR